MELPTNRDVDVPECDHYEPSSIFHLNEDCWRLVLNYLLLEDIVRSERVSKRWQCIVLSYLEGIHIRLQYRRFLHGETRGPKCRILTLDDADPELFDKITTKLGALVVASDCINRASFWSIAQNCPNIESVTISGKLETQLLRSQVVNFKRLKRLTFKRCRFSGVLHGKDFNADIPDYCIKKFLESETLEELRIYDNTEVTGSCLSALKHNLKSLYFINCPNLDVDAFLENVERLADLTKLEMNGIPPLILQNVHMLLDRMPKLEHLSLSRYKETELSASVIESISKLDRLKHLCVKVNQNVTDEWLQAIARGCKKLQTVDIGSCREKRGPIGHRNVIRVTPKVVLEFCQALSSTLTVLSVAYNHNMCNDDVVDCIKACPHLTTLDLQGCGQLTWHFLDNVKRAARDRPHLLSLRLYMSLPGAAGKIERHGDVLLDFDPREWRLPEEY